MFYYHIEMQQRRGGEREHERGGPLLVEKNKNNNVQTANREKATRRPRQRPRQTNLPLESGAAVVVERSGCFWFLMNVVSLSVCFARFVVIEILCVVRVLVFDRYVVST